MFILLCCVHSPDWFNWTAAGTQQLNAYSYHIPQSPFTNTCLSTEIWMLSAVCHSAWILTWLDHDSPEEVVVQKQLCSCPRAKRGVREWTEQRDRHWEKDAVGWRGWQDAAVGRKDAGLIEVESGQWWRMYGDEDTSLLSFRPLEKSNHILPPAQHPPPPPFFLLWLTHTFCCSMLVCLWDYSPPALAFSHIFVYLCMPSQESLCAFVSSVL